MVEPEIKARPAEPLLASELVSDEELDVLMQDVLSVGGPRKRKRCGAVVRSGVSSVDAMLEVGLWRAANGDGDGVVGVSGEGADVCFSTLTKRFIRQSINKSAC
ncbi:hypothetical protein BDV95DRAFT_274835 [Massariosphaeria phaeospora]|uniref:Uncharacterized protein n=1 Tax=Massariosphaeria phaeospora TaxID=100035 RepID=A0A7C8ME54_9PLEO|nr:hypothetical protein BDV95DRAFT_274835 [Massariosphaeria phaeospora]